MKDEAAFNVLSFLLEIVLFTGMVGTALAVRFRRKNGENPATPSVEGQAAASGTRPGATAVWSGEMTPEELAERRHQMLNVAYTLAVVVTSGVVAVAVYLWRHR